MKKDKGLELLDILRRQRITYIRRTDGSKLVTNPSLYNLLEEESIRLQEEIGRENKRKIKLCGLNS